MQPEYAITANSRNVVILCQHVTVILNVWHQGQSSGSSFRLETNVVVKRRCRTLSSCNLKRLNSRSWKTNGLNRPSTSKIISKHEHNDSGVESSKVVIYQMTAVKCHKWPRMLTHDKNALCYQARLQEVCELLTKRTLTTQLQTNGGFFPFLCKSSFNQQLTHQLRRYLILFVSNFFHSPACLALHQGSLSTHSSFMLFLTNGQIALLSGFKTLTL